MVEAASSPEKEESTLSTMAEAALTPEKEESIDITDKYTFIYDTPVQVDKELSVEFTLFRGKPILLLNKQSEG